jgi:chitosanase
LQINSAKSYSSCRNAGAKVAARPVFVPRSETEKREKMMAVRERTIPCSEFTEWKHDLESTGFHVIDSEPIAGKNGLCTLRFEPGADHLAARGPAPAASRGAAPAALSATQKRTAQAIVNIFETGAVLGVYGQVTVIEKDTGHLTFGRSQTTLATGNLARLIGAYCDIHGARFADRLRSYLPALKDCDIALDDDLKLHNLLRATADDPVMRDIQDEFFDTHYWQPAAAQAAAMEIRTPLGIATVYDSIVHGSWERLRDATNLAHGTIDKVKEKAWIEAYIDTRRNWLATHARPDLHATVYRMDTLSALAENDHWSLGLPMLVRDQEISEASLAARPPGCYDGPVPGSRPLAVATPFARGLDVRLVQLGLSDAGLDVKADGVFGPGSLKVVKQYQMQEGLPATGVADLALIARLTA